MVTSSVTSSPLAPAWSGHFTLHSGADKSCTPHSPAQSPLTGPLIGQIVAYPATGMAPDLTPSPRPERDESEEDSMNTLSRRRFLRTSGAVVGTMLLPSG